MKRHPVLPFSSMPPCLAFIGAGLFWGMSTAAAFTGTMTLDFSDRELPLDTDHTGELGVAGFHIEGFHFNNTLTDWGGGFTTWSGWALSNRSDTSTPGFTSETAAISGGGFDAETGTSRDAVYAVAYGSEAGQAVITLPANTAGAPRSIHVTNTTYAYYSMLEGDDFAKKFGGSDGEDPDYFLLTIIGVDSIGEKTGEAEVALADFREEAAFIANEWLEVDLTPLGDQVASLTFALESSDNGDFGMNTPAYFAMGALTIELRTDIISNAYHAEGSEWKHAWLGWYVDSQAPWVFHQNLGWIYWQHSSSGSWVYASGLQGWLWTTHTLFPIVWLPEDQGWWQIDPDSAPGSILLDPAPAN